MDFNGVQPADELISETLLSFDESGVHHAWRKALDRRVSDPEGAITAAKTLVETVCKHIIEEAGGTYGDNDDLPKLYATASEHLNLAPGQHSEIVFNMLPPDTFRFLPRGRLLNGRFCPLTSIRSTPSARCSASLVM